MLRLEAATTLGALTLDVALEAPAGRCLALAGPSGAGKSTILRVAAGLLRPQRGHVALAGTVWLDTARGVDVPAEQRRCGFVFQDYALFGHLTAADNVAYALPRRGRRRDRRARAVALLDRFGVGGLADARPATLSGGERQRVAIARALALDPAVLLLDEPLSALDATTRGAAARELAAVLRDAGVPTLLVTHDFAEAALLGDEVAIVDRGAIVQRDTAAALAARPASAFVADFSGAVVLTGVAAPAADGLTRLALDGGGSVVSTDAATGPAAASVFPWEITLETARAASTGPPGGASARNHLDAEIVSLTEVGNRVRVGLLASQPLAAEITAGARRALDLRPGQRVVATWKAAATRLSAR
ncbi:MAG TPA: ABC transporter ATP-binding protein [Baekduia sp.]|nr:ABC transporter ATP-binding protein [Baekduia sp.]